MSKRNDTLAGSQVADTPARDLSADPVEQILSDRNRKATLERAGICPDAGISAPVANQAADAALQHAEDCCAASDRYFGANPSLDTMDNRRIYSAGFDDAYARLSKMRARVADGRKLGRLDEDVAEAKVAINRTLATPAQASEPIDVLEIARETGLRSYLHGVNAMEARVILQRFVDGLPAASAPASTDAQDRHYTSAMGVAGQKYMDRFQNAHALPVGFRWEGLWNAMQKADASAKTHGEA